VRAAEVVMFNLLSTFHLRGKTVLVAGWRVAYPSGREQAKRDLRASTQAHGPQAVLAHQWLTVLQARGSSGF
jgi:hypothetical protein